MIPADIEIIGCIRWIYWGSASKNFGKSSAVAANPMVVRIGEPIGEWRVEGWAPLVSSGTTCSRSYGVPAGIFAACR